MKENKEVELIGHFAATLSLIEIGLGSVLHGFHIPFAGIFLSLNQGYLLTRASVDSRRLESPWVPYQISNVAAVLKSFSPAGKKLGPMLSISMQGLLFNLGVFLLGVDLLGLSLGMILLSLWGFCQPVLTFYLFFGEDLFKAFKYMLEKTFPYHGVSMDFLLQMLVALVILKALAGVAIVIFARRSKKGMEFQQKMLEIGLKGRPHRDGPSAHPLLLAVKDLLRPLFLCSFCLTAAFVYFTEHDVAETIWILLRPLGIGFIFFYFSRTLTIDRWLEKMETGRGKKFATAAKIALKNVRSVF